MDNHVKNKKYDYYPLQLRDRLQDDPRNEGTKISPGLFIMAVDL